MKEPSPRSSRLALAGALAASIVVGGAGFLLGRGTTERTIVALPATKPILKPTAEPTFEGVLGRSELIALASAAADAAAAKRDPGPEVGKADGRRFELRLPFGCGGPAGEESRAAMRWRYDAEDQALRIHVSPVIWQAKDWWPGDSTSGVETIQGFWIARPWTTAETCPSGGELSSTLGAEPVTLPGQTLAIGQLFFAHGQRGGRRDGEPYETTVSVPKEKLSASKGFQLRISGRISRTGDYGPVRCQQPAGPEQRPICLISIVMDEVAIENPVSKETLSRWDLGAR